MGEFFYETVEMAVRSSFRGDLDSACMHNWGCVDDVIIMNFDCVTIFKCFSSRTPQEIASAREPS